MHEGKRTRGDTSTLEVEDVLTVDLPDDEFVDRDYLRDVFREPRKYLPPRRRRPRRDLEDLEPVPESRLARRAKLAGLTAAVTVLIAAVVAAAVLAERPRREQGATATPRRAISGIEALGALTPIETRASPSVPADAASRSGSRTTETTTAPTTGPATEPTAKLTTESTDESATENGGDEADQADSTSPQSTTTGIAGDRSARTYGPETETRTSRSANKLGTVREFYRLIADAPATALSMLDPKVLGSQLGEALGIWRSLAEVRLHEVRERADGSVLAVVTMLYGDGERVRLTQLLGFRDGRVIDHVQLLSAQHI